MRAHGAESFQGLPQADALTTRGTPAHHAEVINSPSVLIRRWLTAFALLLSTASLAAQTWVNGTGAPTEAQFVNLQWPPNFVVATGLDLSTTVYGQIYHGGVTEPFGANANVVAQLGWGAFGSDPRAGGWVWTNANYNSQTGSFDEYAGQFVTPIDAGTYSYTYRFSMDSGTTWTLGDLDGAGSGAGPFSTAQMGEFTVLTTGTPIPEPTTYAAFAGVLALGVVARRRRRSVR